MTESIELTEDDISIIHNENNVNDCYVRFTLLEGIEIILTKEQAEQIKKQILENQEKVKKYDGVVSSLNERISDIKTTLETNFIEEDMILVYEKIMQEFCKLTTKRNLT